MDLLGRWLRALRPAAGVVHRPAQHLRAPGQGPGPARRRDAVRPGLAGAGHRADPGTQPAGQGTRRALLRHGPGPLGQGDCVWPRSTTIAAGQRGAGAAAARAQPPLRRAGRARPATRTGRWGRAHNLAAILSVQEERVVANDYTVRFQNRFYQLLTSRSIPGERGGRVVIELRLDGSMAIRFREQLPEVPRDRRRVPALGALPPDPRSLAHSAADASGEKRRPGLRERRPGPLAYSRPAGARVALLRSPIPLLCTTGGGYNSRALLDMESPA